MTSINIEVRVNHNGSIGSWTTQIDVSDFYAENGYRDHNNTNPEVKDEEYTILDQIKSKFNNGQIVSWKMI